MQFLRRTKSDVDVATLTSNEANGTVIRQAYSVTAVHKPITTAQKWITNYYYSVMLISPKTKMKNAFIQTKLFFKISTYLVFNDL